MEFSVYEHLLMEEEEKKSLVNAKKIKSLFLQLQKFARTLESKVYDKFTKLDKMFIEVSKSNPKGKTKKEYNKEFVKGSLKATKILMNHSQSYKTSFLSSSSSSVKTLDTKEIHSSAEKLVSLGDDSSKNNITIGEAQTLREALADLRNIYKLNVATMSKAVDITNSIIKSEKEEMVDSMFSIVRSFNIFIGKINKFTNKATLILYKILKDLSSDSEKKDKDKDNKEDQDL